MVTKGLHPDGFATIPNSIVLSDGFRSLVGVDAAVLIVLLAHRNLDSGLAWPSGDTVAGYIGRSRRVVAPSVQRLKAAGLITVERRWCAGATRNVIGFPGVDQWEANRPTVNRPVGSEPPNGQPTSGKRTAQRSTDQWEGQRRPVGRSASTSGKASPHEQPYPTQRREQTPGEGERCASLDGGREERLIGRLIASGVSSATDAALIVRAARNGSEPTEDELHDLLSAIGLSRDLVIGLAHFWRPARLIDVTKALLKRIDDGDTIRNLQSQFRSYLVSNCTEAHVRVVTVARDRSGYERVCALLKARRGRRSA